MASNDYYNSFGNDQRYNNHQDTSYHGAGHRTDEPVSPIPDSHLAPSANTYPHQSPFNTPFDDSHGYSPYNQSTQSLNPSTSFGDSAHHDPFRDSGAIPLQTKPGKGPYGDGAASPTTAMANAEQFGGPRYENNDKEQPRGPAGWFKGKKIPFAVYTLTLVQLIVFLVEIIKNATLTGSPIEIHPTFNPMIGPSPYVLINMGARFVPCMHKIGTNQTSVTVAQIPWPCPNATSTDTAPCSLSNLCGFGMDLQADQQPDQWFRFIVPIFLHGGIIHIGFNLLLQLTLGKDIERAIGTIRFVLVYFASGIFGFVFGGNFSPNGILSTGCSGALFGIIAIVLLDLLYTWKSRRNPVRDLMFIILDIVISFGIGLLPGLDNFSHIGGFITGITLGICILHSPDVLRERIGLDEPPYASMQVIDANNNTSTGLQAFVRQPVGFFKGRKPLWWAWWLLRAGALAAIFAAFIALLNRFYNGGSNCTWCKYLSCLPIKNWCEVGNIPGTQIMNKRAAAIFGIGMSPA